MQVADGIRYLHSLYIVHRDIKPSNVLIWSLHPDKGVDVKLADYGVSQFNTPGGLHRHRGTEEYMAPELFRHSYMAYDEKVRYQLKSVALSSGSPKFSVCNIES